MDRRNSEPKNYDKRTLPVRRVAKVNAGGKRLRFSVMVIVGDRKGSVGVALGRGIDTRSAIEKAEKKAAAHMKKIEVLGDTIPHELYHKLGAAKIVLRPAKPGTGIVAGMAARNVLEMAGIENVYCKQLGTSDLIANTYCVFEALQLLKKGRVLEKMTKMRERIGLKEKMDEEKKKKMAKKFAKKKKEKFNVKSNRNATRKTTTKKK